MKLSGYLRVSTDRQAEHGNGLEVQKQAISRWAKAEGHVIAAWFTDAGESGSNGLKQRKDPARRCAASSQGRRKGSRSTGWTG